MATRETHTRIYLFLVMAAAIIGLSESRIASEAVYLKLRNALVANHTNRYMMQEVFFPSQDFPPDWLYLYVCVTVNSFPSGNCSNFDGQGNHSYYQKFQWSSYALANLI